MGKFTIERWRCDRCHVEAPKWLKPSTAYSVRVNVDYGTAGGTEIEWAELCVDCAALVGRLTEGMKRDALEARRQVKSHAD